MQARLTFPPASEDIGAIRACHLFDVDWYLETYPDVKALGMDPAEHFLWFGARLDRNPSLRFNTAAHRRMNPETADDTANPLLRFISRRQSAESPAAGPGEVLYSDWIARNDTLGDGDRALIHRHMAKFRNRPKFSILMPVYNPPGDYLRQAIESVLAQLYPDWELCIADDASRASHIRPILEAYAGADTRIKLAFRDKNDGISASSNTALAMAGGDWIVLMDHDDLLSEHALYLVAEALDRRPDAVIVYSDEDHMDAGGLRYPAYFKPDWDHDLFLCQNLINHLGAYRADLARQIGGFREGFEGSQDWDFALRMLDAAPGAGVHHVPFILYHWRQTESSFSKASLGRAVDAACLAVNGHFARTGQAAEAVPQGSSSHLRIRRALPARRPLVSIVIPTRDRCDLLRACIGGLIHRTDYKPVEILVVDNASSEAETLAYFTELSSRDGIRIVSQSGPFNFSRLMNRGVAASSGEVCVLLNNDVDVINSDWLDAMVGHALRPEVGAVGAKLYYADETLQHGGVILGIGGVAGHPHKRFPRGAAGYFNRLNLTQTLSCVTAACLAIRRAVFDEIGGFDEENLAVSFNDVDFCIRLGQAGYRIIWTPDAELYHYESLSRGDPAATPQDAERNSAEIAYMKRRWGGLLESDPFYNPNLSLKSESFQLAEETRAQKPWLKIAPQADDQHPTPCGAAKLNWAADPRRVNVVNFVAIHGMSGHGKTSLARALSQLEGFIWVHSDSIFDQQVAALVSDRHAFLSFPGEAGREHFNIGRYVDSDRYDHDLFTRLLADELRRRLRETPMANIVLLDGYVLKHHGRIFSDLGIGRERTVALQATRIGGRHMVENFDVTGFRYDDVVGHIRKIFRSKCVASTIPKSTYQDFTSLGIRQAGSRSADSDTTLKYDASHLDDIIQPASRVADIGCNAGFFCFRIAQRTRSAVVGIDTAKVPLELASHINNSIFLHDNISFIEGEAVALLCECSEAFDIIHCASTYHYFRDRQLAFLQSAHRALSPDGKLVLEVELADSQAGPEMIQRSRGVDAIPCYFPNRARFREQLDGLFHVEGEFDSAFQRGSFYPRIYFHLRPA